MKPLSIFAALMLGLFVAGCVESPPVDPKPANGSNAHVSGTPEERIQSIQANPSLTPEEKAQRIKAIKERNNIP